ncbi:MAG: hypothetical protein ACWA5P_00410 [bacterium]
MIKAKNLHSALLMLVILMSGFGFAQIDSRNEGIRIEPSDSTQINADLQFSLKISPSFSLTDKKVEYKVNYVPLADSFKKKRGIDITERSKLITPTWKVRHKFTEDQKNISKFHKDYNLGSISTGSKVVILQCRDHEYVDGDRIKLMVNKAVIHPNLTLKGEFYTVDVDLKDGINTIEFIALNEGSSRPNTAQIRVFDENGGVLATNKWLITTGFRAVLTVVRN